MRVVRHRNSMSREAVDTSSLEAFKAVGWDLAQPDLIEGIPAHV